mmetsp:Transcript_11620/g.17322  ORF Transcript_11620/g.17322 Transcript_11620/m.17322 type:complete len:118 (-) Transcript_11620:509-862(-)
MTRFLLPLAIIAVYSSFASAFVPTTQLPSSHLLTQRTSHNRFQQEPLFAEDKRDVSRSGTKRGRLDKLAELEDSRVETDKGFVLKAAGGFVGFIVVLLVAALASGVLDDVGGGGGGY